METLHSKKPLYRSHGVTLQTILDRQGDFTIEDFKVDGKNHASNDKEFQYWLIENFKYCRDAYEERNEEAKRLWEVYENVRRAGALGTLKKVRNGEISFSSAMTATKIWILACIISEQMQRIYIDPVFGENAEQQIAFKLQLGIIPEWMGNAIQEEGFEGFWNNTIDRITDVWWAKESLYTKTFITKQRGLVQSEAWAKLRIEDGKILYENVPINYVFEDPDAISRNTRRYLWNVVPMHTRDIEIQYQLPRDSVIPDGVISGLNDGFNDEDDRPNNVKYKFPQCYLIEGYLKDRTTLSNGEKVYPNGRVVCFIYGQQTDTGVQILDDYEYQFSEWPLFKFVPRPATETRGMSVSANIEAVEKIANEILNIGINNMRECGTTKLLYKKGSIEDPNQWSKNSEKIEIDDIRSAQFLQAQGVSAEAMNLYAMLNGIGDDISSIHEASRGRKPTGIESGKALMALDASTVRAANPYIENFKSFLMPLAHLYGQMLLSVVGPGYIVRYGQNFRKSYRIPISLYSVVEDTEGFVGVDNEMPMDTQTKFNFLMGMGDRIPVETLLEFAPIENKEKIIREAGELQKLRQAVEQLQQQNQALQQDLQAAGMEVDKRDTAIQDMQTASKAGIIKNEYDMVKQDKQLASTHQREAARQEGKLKDTKLRGDYQLATTALQARVNKLSGSQSKGESQKR